MEKLINLSLVEHSTKNRYRLHPAIRKFVRENLDYPRSSKLLNIAYFMFGFYVLWWLYLQIFIQKTNIQYSIFAGSYGLLAVYGGIFGLHTSFKWGGLRTLMGRAIFMFSLGLFLQAFGQFDYGYYVIFLHIQVPYPSIGDIGYFGTIPFYIYGTLLLSRAAGIKLNIQLFREKLIALIVPVIMLIIGYMLFLRDYSFDWSNPVKVFLDFAYPLGESIFISLAIIIVILSRNIFDGIMRSRAMLILVALFLQFIADYVFLYGSSYYYSGSYMDFLYLISYFIMTIALFNLKSLLVKSIEV